MSFDWVIRDTLELAMVIALGAMVVSAVARIRRGEIVPHICASCSRPISRVYHHCPKCGVAQP